MKTKEKVLQQFDILEKYIQGIISLKDALPLYEALKITKDYIEELEEENETLKEENEVLTDRAEELEEENENIKDGVQEAIETLERLSQHDGVWLL